MDKVLNRFSTLAQHNSSPYLLPHNDHIMDNAQQSAKGWLKSPRTAAVSGFQIPMDGDGQCVDLVTKDRGVPIQVSMVLSLRYDSLPVYHFQWRTSGFLHKRFDPTHSGLINGQSRLGVDRGPIHLVEAGLLKQLTELGWQVKFDGHHQFEEINTDNDPPIGILKNPRLVSRVSRSVAEVVGSHVKSGELPVTLGGDHSLVSAGCRCRFHVPYVLMCFDRRWAPYQEH